MISHTIQDLDGLRKFAVGLAGNLSARHILLLDGPMGAGKTAFTRFLVEALGSTETVSPSFAIHNQYETKRGLVDHVDLYRLESEDDLESTGFWDLFASAEGLVIIEWAERLPKDSLPVSWKKTRLEFEITGPSCRRINEDS